MDIFKMITDSPWYYFLFGTGGILIVIVTIWQILKSQKKKNDEEKIKIEVNVENNNKNHNDHNENIAYDDSIIKNDYKKHSFSSDEFYIGMLSQVEEKKRKGDRIDYE